MFIKGALKLKLNASKPKLFVIRTASLFNSSLRIAIDLPNILC